MWQIPDSLRETKSLQHRPARWIQAIAAHFFPGKFFPLKNKRPQTSARAILGTYRSSGSAADDCDIKDFHRIQCRKKRGCMEALLLSPKTCNFWLTCQNFCRTSKCDERRGHEQRAARCWWLVALFL